MQWWEGRRRLRLELQNHWSVQRQGVWLGKNTEWPSAGKTEGEDDNSYGAHTISCEWFQSPIAYAPIKWNVEESNLHLGEG